MEYMPSHGNVTLERVEKKVCDRYAFELIHAYKIADVEKIHLTQRSFLRQDTLTVKLKDGKEYEYNYRNAEKAKMAADTFEKVLADYKN